MLAIQLNDLLLFIEWCKVLSIQDNKVHLCHSRNLGTEMYDHVMLSDIKIGSEVIWRCKGVPYTVQIQKGFGKLYTYLRKYCEFIF